MDWSEENLASYSAFLSRIVGDRGLLHFDRSAVARIVEHGARLRDHQRKLTARFLDIARLAVEASHWAGKAGHEFVLAEDVDTAIAHQERRRNLVEERTREVIVDGTVMIDTEGARVAQVNGLSVISVGDYDLPILLLGILYMSVARRWLPDTATPASSSSRPNLATWIDEYKLADRERRLRITAQSPLAGKTLDELNLRGWSGAENVAIERRRRVDRTS